MAEKRSEIMTPLMVRVKEKHRAMVKSLAKKLDMSEAKVIRTAIEKLFYS